MNPQSPIQAVPHGVSIRIRVIPRASRSQVSGLWGDSAVRLAVTSPPVDGAANKAVVEFLADLFRVAKGAVTITQGQTSRNKTVEVEGVDLAEAFQKMGLEQEPAVKGKVRSRGSSAGAGGRGKRRTGKRKSRKMGRSLLAVTLVALGFLLSSTFSPPAARGSTPVTTEERPIQSPRLTETWQTGNLVFYFEERLRPMAIHLGSRALEEMEPMVRELALNDELAGEVIHIHLVPDLQEMGRMLGFKVSPWVAGLALTNQPVILIRLDIEGTDQVNRLHTTLLHEIAHVLTMRATGGVRPPRWFMEGYAILKSKEVPFERIKYLTSGALTDSLIPLEYLDSSFPAEPVKVNLAYAQSISFVTWLLNRDPHSFGQIMTRMGQGEDFYSAIASAYRMDVEKLEERWLNSLKGIYMWIPLAMGGGLVWVFGALIILVGFLKRKRENRKRLAVWAVEEALADLEQEQSTLRGEETGAGQTGELGQEPVGEAT